MPTPFAPQEIWDTEVATCQDPAADWLWPGFIARGNITLLTSLWKSGKTTLVSHLLARRKSGGDLAGLPVTPGKSAVVTEEPRALWAERTRQHQFGGTLCLFPRPFVGIPQPGEWQALIDRIGELHEQHGLDLVVIDPLAHFLRTENHAHGILEVLLPLRKLTDRGMAALILHHPGKREAGRGLAARGHGALHGNVDISIEMRHPGGDPDSRARRFFSLSRHAATPRHFLFELNADGTDYIRLEDGGAAADDFERTWNILRLVLADAPQKLTRLDILDEWPDDYPKPNPVTLWEWLGQAVASKRVLVEGSGRKTDPFRYWLPESEARWRENPLHDFFEKQLKELNLPFESLRERKRKLQATDKGE